MRILLDECVPRPLRRELRGHEVRTVQEMGWAGKKNGELLPFVVSSGFDIFLTTDQNLKYQQNLRAAGIAVVVLIARTNRLSDLMPLMPSVRKAIPSLTAGALAEINA